jgi:hypothetical protein
MQELFHFVFMGPESCTVLTTSNFYTQGLSVISYLNILENKYNVSLLSSREKALVCLRFLDLLTSNTERSTEPSESFLERSIDTNSFLLWLSATKSCNFQYDIDFNYTERTTIESVITEKVLSLVHENK